MLIVLCATVNADVYLRVEDTIQLFRQRLLFRGMQASSIWMAFIAADNFVIAVKYPLPHLITRIYIFLFEARGVTKQRTDCKNLVVKNAIVFEINSMPCVNA